MSEPIFISARSFAESPATVADELSCEIGRQDTPATLLLLFASQEHAGQLGAILQHLATKMDLSHLMGCTGVAIVADDREIEDRHGVVLWAAWLPGATVDFSHVKFQQTPEGASFIGFASETVADADETTILQLAEPYSFPTDVFLQRINEDHPHLPVVGGIASGGLGPGESKLIFQDRVVAEGAIVTTIRNFPIQAFVSQGCRPVGEPLVITKAERNVIYQLGGKNAMDQLQAVYQTLPNRDKELLQRGVHVGRVINEYQDRFDYGDFLIRNVNGFHQDDGSLLVGDYMRVGQTLQFHVRDAATASEDLRQMLARTPSCNPQAALLFTCNGRGTRLFDEPHHDASMISKHFGPDLPVAGFFCQGEIGPVGGLNFLHGFSASVALFGQRNV